MGVGVGVRVEAGIRDGFASRPIGLEAGVSSRGFKPQSYPYAYAYAYPYHYHYPYPYPYPYP
jgi:hypothetical protein